MWLRDNQSRDESDTKWQPEVALDTERRAAKIGVGLCEAMVRHEGKTGTKVWCRSRCPWLL